MAGARGEKPQVCFIPCMWTGRSTRGAVARLEELRRDGGLAIVAAEVIRLPRYRRLLAGIERATFREIREISEMSGFPEHIDGLFREFKELRRNGVGVDLSMPLSAAPSLKYYKFRSLYALLKIDMAKGLEYNLPHIVRSSDFMNRLDSAKKRAMAARIGRLVSESGGIVAVVGEPGSLGHIRQRLGGYEVRALENPEHTRQDAQMAALFEDLGGALREDRDSLDTAIKAAKVFIYGKLYASFGREAVGVGMRYGLEEAMDAAASINSMADANWAFASINAPSFFREIIGAIRDT